jgi:PilZ domain
LRADGVWHTAALSVPFPRGAPKAVTSENRQHPRHSYPLDATWTGASGTTHSRVADISVGGCFVQSLAMPAAGETTTVTLVDGDRQIVLRALVVYAEPGMGFAVRFVDVGKDELDALARLTGAGKDAPRPA